MKKLCFAWMELSRTFRRRTDEDLFFLCNRLISPSNIYRADLGDPYKRVGGLMLVTRGEQPLTELKKLLLINVKEGCIVVVSNCDYYKC